MSILDDNTDPRTSNAATCGNPERALPTCLDWCTHLTDPKYSYVRDHSFDLDEDADGNPMRKHSIEYGVVEASRDRVRDTELIPDVFVCLLQSESVTSDGLRRGEFEIGIAADDYPHLSAGEARRVAAMLTAAADKLEELESGTGSVSPCRTRRTWRPCSACSR